MDGSSDFSLLEVLQRALEVHKTGELQTEENERQQASTAGHLNGLIPVTVTDDQLQPTGVSTQLGMQQASCFISQLKHLTYYSL